MGTDETSEFGGSQVGRRRFVAAGVWSAPVVVLATAVPALAASGARALERVEPVGAVFSAVDLSESRVVSARLLDGSSPVPGRVVSFALGGADTSWARLSTVAATTGGDGVASTMLQYVAGSAPADGAQLTVLASFEGLQVSWAVTYRPLRLIAAGGATSLAASGTSLFGWGANQVGQVGDNSTVDRSAPVLVDTAGSGIRNTTLISLAVGGTHCIASGRVGGTGAPRTAVWGSNAHGQLSRGDVGGFSSRPTALRLTEDGIDAPQVRVVAGLDHCLGLGDLGVVSWGRGDAAELATTDYVDRPVAGFATARLDGVDVVDLAASNRISAAIVSDGSTRRVWTWGNLRTGGDFVQLGRDTGDDGDYQPAPVTTQDTDMEGRDIAEVACGTTHVLARDVDGGLYSWGVNANGELGNDLDSSLTPRAIVTGGTALQGRTIVALAAGRSFSMALTADGRVLTWGRNSRGQLGIGTTSASNTKHIAPVEVVTAGTPMAGKRIVRIAAGDEHCLALSDDGLVFAWGNAANGRLGNGATSGIQNTPVQVRTVP